jgi:hypothetical protein
MKKHILSGAVGVSLLAASVHAQSVYSEDFESITTVGGAGLYSWGYDSTPSGFATKQVDYGVWAWQSANSLAVDVDADPDLELRPNIDGANNAKVIGAILDPTLFAATGSGTYTFSVDLIGADVGNSRIFLWSANGYDASGSNNLLLDAAEGGFGTYNTLQGTGSTNVAKIFEYQIPDETVGGSYSVEFEYTAGDALAIAFGSYNTGFAYDNLDISLVPEPSSFAMLAGCFALASVMIRRRR